MIGLEPTEVRVKLRILRSFSCNVKYDSVANAVSGGAGEACVACTIKKQDVLSSVCSRNHNFSIWKGYGSFLGRKIYGSTKKLATFLIWNVDYFIIIY